MKKTAMAFSAFVLLFSGCTIETAPTQAASLKPLAANTQVFYKNQFKPAVELTLRPDLFVIQQIPNVTPPKEAVIVYLPLYPSAVSVKPGPKISDMGTPMDGDLVDGTLYFESRNSQAQIKSWYNSQFQKLGYKMSGQGQTGIHGVIVSDFFDFTKNGAPGKPTQAPDVNLGFLTQQQNGETIFKIKALYIVIPTRPKDSYVSADIVRVVLTDGNLTKTITDRAWISHVVEMMNSLQVSTPEIIGGGPAVTPDMVKTIHADFYEESGSVIPVKFSFPFGGVQVGNSGVTLSDTSILGKDIESVFGG